MKLQQALEFAASQVCNESRQRYGPLWNAYQTACNVLFILTEQGAEEATVISEDSSKRLSLTANLIQSSTIVEYLISSGYYFASAAVLRQQMETLARLIELRKGKPISGKRPPNVNVLPFKLAQNYGRLSELCHTSGGELLSCFADSPDGDDVAKVRPSYREEWARGFLFIHIAHMVALALEIDILHREIHPSRNLANIEQEINAIADVLVRTGFWKPLENKK